MHANAPLHVEAVSSLGDRAAEWDAILDTQDLVSPFLRSWWVDNTAGGRPAIVLCSSEGELVGGAAFEMGRVGRGPLSAEVARFVGQGVLEPDHLDVVSRPDMRRRVSSAVAGWLRGADRVVDLDGLSPDSLLPAALGAPVIASTACPTMSLTGGDPLAALPGRLRSTATRTLKRLARQGIEPRRVDPADAEAALDRLMDLHEGRWVDESRFLAGWARFRAAALEGMSRGEVVIHELAGADGTVVASELELVVGGRASFYQAGRLTDHDLRGSGTALKAVVLRWVAGQGCTEFDFLRGAESYKDDWADGSRSVLRIRVGTGPRGRTAATAGNTLVRTAPRIVELAGRVVGEERARDLNERLGRAVN